MVHAPIIPNRHIIHPLPLEPDLQVMILHNQLAKPPQEMLALVLGQPVDPLHVVAHGKHRLPPRDRVGADDGVHGLEHLADVLRRAARRRVHGEVVALGGGREERLRVVRGERVEEGAQRRGDAVVQLVAGRPEGVAARLGELGEAEERVVAGDGLERDVRVPLVLVGLPAPVADPRGAAGAAGGAEAVRVERFLLLRGDDADFVVATAVLARRVADGVDVEARGGGLAGELAEALDEFLLEVVGEVVLLAEEDDAALGDWGVLVRVQG